MAVVLQKLLAKLKVAIKISSSITKIPTRDLIKTYFMLSPSASMYCFYRGQTLSRRNAINVNPSFGRYCLDLPERFWMTSGLAPTYQKSGNSPLPPLISILYTYSSEAELCLAHPADSQEAPPFTLECINGIRDRYRAGSACPAFH